MMSGPRPEIPERLEQGRVVAILRRTEPGAAVATAEALARGGIRTLEVTCDSPGAVEMIGAISRELGDSTHEVANMTQANRLWQESGLDEAAFVTLLQEARQRTRRAQGGQGTGVIDNRAAYYFHVVRQLVTALVEQ